MVFPSPTGSLWMDSSQPVRPKPERPRRRGGRLPGQVKIASSRRRVRQERLTAVRAREPKVAFNAVFLNIPYDEKFRRLYLAYISGLVHLGLQPRATLEISGAENRLDKIVTLIQSCRYSIHDLSWVKLDGPPPRTPRFNMPFELGLAMAIERIDRAQRKSFVFEAVNRRLAKSLSDLSGIDPHIHDRAIEGVMRELGNAFVRRVSYRRLSVPAMMKTYRAVLRSIPEIDRQTGSTDLFRARPFRLLCIAAGKAAGVGASR